MPPRKPKNTGVTSDFRDLLDVRFSRVDESLDRIQSDLKRQNDEREAQFRAAEAKTLAALKTVKEETQGQFDNLERKVDASDRALKIVGGVSAGAGSVFGVAMHYLWSKITGH